MTCPIWHKFSIWRPSYDAYCETVVEARLIEDRLINSPWASSLDDPQQSCRSVPSFV